MMKELAEQKSVRRIDYGFGEPRYRLTNDVDERVRVIMARKGVINWSLVTAHGAYESLVQVTKRVIQK
jgi:hypothetical protein